MDSLKFPIFSEMSSTSTVLALSLLISCIVQIAFGCLCKVETPEHNYCAADWGSFGNGKSKLNSQILQLPEFWLRKGRMEYECHRGLSTDKLSRIHGTKLSTNNCLRQVKIHGGRLTKSIN
jgi:hypothetical protein